MLPTDTVINTLRVHVRRTIDAGEISRRVERRLQAAQWSVASLPPSAVLIVKSLVDPLPGALTKDRNALHPPSLWQQALDQCLSDALANAVRPDSHGRVATHAETVLFADTSELCAYIAVELATGSFEHPWIRQMAVRSMPELQDCSSVAQLLRARVEQLPAIVSCLHGWNSATDVLSALDSAEAVSLTVSLATVHGLSELQELDGLGAESSRFESESETRDIVAGIATEPTDRHRAGEVSRAVRSIDTVDQSENPFYPIIELSSSLKPEQTCLLGLSVTLTRAPRRARSVGFAEQVRRWLFQRQTMRSHGPFMRNSEPEPIEYAPIKGQDEQAKTERQRSESIPTTKRTVDAPAETSGVDALQKFADPASDRRSAPMEEAIRVDDRTQSRVATYDTTASSPAVQPVQHDRKQHLDQLNPKRTAIEPDLASVSAPCSKREDAQAPSNARATDLTDTTEPLSAPAAVETGLDFGSSNEAVFETRIGGLFYLINLLDRLELPEIFEVDYKLASCLGAWGTLELLARALLGTAVQTDDPIWRLLATLDGRTSGESLGIDLPSFDAFRLPLKWWERANIVSPQFDYSTDQGRLRLREATSRIWLLDLPTTGDNHTKAMAPYGRVTPGVDLASTARQIPAHALFTESIIEAEALEVGNVAPNALGWANFVMPFVRFHLEQALGASASTDSIATVLQMPARVMVSPMHVDVVASLESISIPVRMAGLDRNPGWIAAFGRVVLLHFE